MELRRAERYREEKEEVWLSSTYHRRDDRRVGLPAHAKGQPIPPSVQARPGGPEHQHRKLRGTLQTAQGLRWLTTYQDCILYIDQNPRLVLRRLFAALRCTAHRQALLDAASAHGGVFNGCLAALEPARKGQDGPHTFATEYGLGSGELCIGYARSRDR